MIASWKTFHSWCYSSCELFVVKVSYLTSYIQIKLLYTGLILSSWICLQSITEYSTAIELKFVTVVCPFQLWLLYCTVLCTVLWMHYCALYCTQQGTVCISTLYCTESTALCTVNHTVCKPFYSVCTQSTIPAFSSFLVKIIFADITKMFAEKVAKQKRRPKTICF